MIKISPWCLKLPGYLNIKIYDNPARENNAKNNTAGFLMNDKIIMQDNKNEINMKTTRNSIGIKKRVCQGKNACAIAANMAK